MISAGCPKEENGSTARDDAPPIQQSSDDGALAKLMKEMKEAADAVITELESEHKEGGDAEQLFRKGLPRIHEEMRPEFGPANAWLFNERETKIMELCRRLSLTADTCVPIVEEANLPDE